MTADTTEVEFLFDRFRKLTNDEAAAASLVVAQMMRDTPKIKSKCPSAWLNIEQAAELIGISAPTLKEWCNYLDPKTGKHAPKIEHIRVGACGRQNQKNGRRGKIKIHRDVVTSFVANRTATPPVQAETTKPNTRRLPFRSPRFAPATA